MPDWFFFRPKRQPTCKIIEYKSANALSKRNEIKFAKKHGRRSDINQTLAAMNMIVCLKLYILQILVLLVHVSLDEKT